MTMKRMLLGASGITALCYTMVLVNKTVGSVLDGTFRLLVPGCRRNPA